MSQPGAPGRPSAAETLPVDQRSALGMIGSGRYLPSSARRGARALIVVALEHDAAGLADLAEELLSHQLLRPFLKPVVLTSARDAAPLTAAGLLYETAMDAPMWQGAGFTGSHADYLEERIAEMSETYLAPRVVIARPGRRLPRWALEK